MIEKMRRIRKEIKFSKFFKLTMKEDKFMLHFTQSLETVCKGIQVLFKKIHFKIEMNKKQNKTHNKKYSQNLN